METAKKREGNICKTEESNAYIFYYFIPYFLFSLYLCNDIKCYTIMTIVTTREFRANQSKFLGMVRRGEHVVLKSRLGSFRLTPEEEEEPKRNVTEEVCRGLKEWKKYLETGESDYFRPAEELLYELQNSNR